MTNLSQLIGKAMDSKGGKGSNPGVKKQLTKTLWKAQSLVLISGRITA